MTAISFMLSRARLPALLFLGAIMPAHADDTDVLSQKALEEAIATHAPETEGYVKDMPILAWSLTGDGLEDLPDAIRDVLGSVDRTKYADDYLAENIGSVVALQMNADGPDFYIIGKETFDESYEEVPIEQVVEKNAEAVERLEMVPEVKALFDAGDPSVTAVLKTEPVEMIRLSEIGLPVEEETTIAAPWGEQTKPAGQEGFLVFDSGEEQYYLVNEGKDGNPLGYVPAD